MMMPGVHLKMYGASQWWLMISGMEGRLPGSSASRLASSYRAPGE